MPGSSIWDKGLGRIEHQVGQHSYSTWFKPTALLADLGDSLSILVPNLLFVEWLPKHYSVVLAEALREAGRPDVRLVFVPEAKSQAHLSQTPTALHATRARPADPYEPSNSNGPAAPHPFVSAA